MWNLPPPPSFQGLRDDLPLHSYMRHMPHWRQDGATYFVTFRLGDSLPQSKLEELARLKSNWEKRHPKPHSRAVLDELARQVFERVEDWLDMGAGDCVLREPSAAQQVANAMHYFDGDRYELGCYVVMPNHVHVIVRPTQPGIKSLEDILKSWKGYSSRQINSARGQSGELWQDESYDRIIRDEEHLWRTIQYIGKNMNRANLPPQSCPLWIRPDWAKLGWKFIDT